MKLLSIRFKNFMSYGNVPTEIIFSNENELIKTTGIVGKNGSGKSAIFDAIFFALFNKSYRKLSSKSRLINKENKKDMFVELKIESNGHIFVIKRGMESSAKSYVVLYKDEEEVILDAHSNDIQKVIETQILGINENIFRLVFMIGLGVFTSFFEKSLPERRAVFEFIVGLNVLSTMLDMVKKKNSKDNKELEKLKNRLIITKEKKNNNMESLKDVEKLASSNFDNDIIDTKKVIKNIEKELKKIDIEETLKKSNKIEEEISKIVKNINKYRKELQEQNILKSQDFKILKFFLENTICPTCTQDLTEEFRVKKEKELKNKISINQKKSEKIKKNLELLESEKEEKEDKQEKLEEVIEKESSLKRDKKHQENTLKKFENKKEESDITTKEVIEKIKSELDVIKKEIKEIKNDGIKKGEVVYLNEIFIEILGDNGIKKYIYNIILKQINKYINTMMISFNFNYKVKLDSNLKEFFYERIGEDREYNGFSNAEKLICNISFLFGVLRFIEEFYGFKSNTLFFDEILDTSLDKENKAFLLELLQSVDKNIVIISHDQELSSIFDMCYGLKRIGRFSEITKLEGNIDNEEE